jgi:hypothetical protein
MNRMEITCVTIDCHDPGVVATFWNEALHWGGAAVAPDGGGAICGPAGGGMYLEFIRVPEAKVVKNRVHLGCDAGPLEELPAELERLATLGASVAWEEVFPPAAARHYLTDFLPPPERNEFGRGAGSLPGSPDPPRSPLTRRRPVPVGRWCGGGRWGQ